MSRLHQRGYAAKMLHLKPRIIVARRSDPDAAFDKPHDKPPRSALVSVAKIVVWLTEAWYASFFQEEKKTLLICDRYYHDLLVDPKRYRYGGPLWTAVLVGKLMPQPSLWILLDAPAEVLQARKQEVPLEETARQRDAYLAFVRTRRHYLIVDASQALEKVIADVEQAVTRKVS